MKKFFLLILTLGYAPSLLAHPKYPNPIRTAIYSGDISKLEKALAGYSDSNILVHDINENDSVQYNNGTVLLLACNLKEWEMVKLLLATRTIKNLDSQLHGKTALCYALEETELEIVEELLKDGAKLPSATYLENEIFNEFNRKNEIMYKILNTLRQHGFDINKPGYDNETLLHYAARRKDHREIYYLLLHGADKSINSPNKNGDTPFHLAVQTGSTKLADLLLIYGADINKTAAYGYAPIHSASWKHNSDMVKFLLKKDSHSINAITQRGCTPLFFAISKNNDNGCAIELLKQGAHENIKIDHRILHTTVKQNNLEMVKLLLYLKAQINFNTKQLPLIDDKIIDPIKYLIANPQDLESCCTEDELKEFKEIEKMGLMSSSGKDIYNQLHNNPNYLDIEFKFN